MRISDWSSDVCSSDLEHLVGHPAEQDGVRLEEVLVEVFARDLAGAEGELPAQAAAGIDVGSQGGVSARGVRLVSHGPHHVAPGAVLVWVACLTSASAVPPP